MEPAPAVIGGQVRRDATHPQCADRPRVSLHALRGRGAVPAMDQDDVDAARSEVGLHRAEVVTHPQLVGLTALSGEVLHEDLEAPEARWHARCRPAAPPR